MSEVGEQMEVQEEVFVPTRLPLPTALSKKKLVRDLAILIIRSGTRLKVRNRTVASAIVMVFKILTSSRLPLCPYTLATACMSVAVKQMDEHTIGIRDVVNCFHRVLHIEEVPLEVGEDFWDIRYGVARLEFIVLRQLGYDIEFVDPFNNLAIYLDALRAWIPYEFEKFPVVASSNAILRDCFVDPEFVLQHPPEHIALAAIAFTCRGYGVEFPVAKRRKWWQILFKGSLSERRLRRLEENIAIKVYNLDEVEPTPTAPGVDDDDDDGDDGDVAGRRHRRGDGNGDAGDDEDDDDEDDDEDDNDAGNGDGGGDVVESIPLPPPAKRRPDVPRSA